jgi:hypothetical protein
MRPNPKKKAARRSSLPPARGEGVAPSGAEARPTPVRESLEVQASPPSLSPEPDLEFARFEVAGRPWVATVVGRGRVGSAPNAAAVILLGFSEGEDPASPSREAMVAARDLAGLTPFEIEKAFGSSSPVRDPSERKELFPESSSKRRRGSS